MKYKLILMLWLVAHSITAQKLLSNKSTTKFYSYATLEDITATSTKGKSAINASNGEIAFVIPITSFEFSKSLMQEHFNEKYMESEKFPKANFSGTIDGWVNGEPMEEAIANGKLTIHGVTKEVTAKGSLSFEKNKLIVEAKFEVKLEDFEIEVPSLMFQKIAEVLEITIKYEYPTNE